MKLFKLLLIMLILTGHVFSQTLFEDKLSANPSGASLDLNARSSTTAKSVIKAESKKNNSRIWSTNLESVIIRGDVQFLYEIPKEGGWSTMYMVHINPQSSFNDITGDLGAMVGGRLYMDGFLKSTPIFLQGLAGFNHNDQWDLNISVEFGQRINWKPNIFLDVSAVVNRSYASDLEDPTAYLKVNISFGLDRPILPFL